MSSTVGSRVRTLRERRGLSQSDLVEGLPIAPSYVSLIERDRRKPSERVLAVIAGRLGCTVDYLLTGRRGPGAQELELELRFAELALRSGDPRSARERFEQAADQATALGLEDIAHDARWGLTRAYEALGELEAAIEGLEALSREPELKGTFSRLALSRRLARTHLECGESARAIEVAELGLAERGVDELLAVDERAELAATLVACYYERGDISRAHLLARRVVEEAEKGGSSRARAAAYWEAGIVAEGRGDFRAARIYTERALALYGEGDNARAVAGLRMNCAWLMLHSAEPEIAEATGLLEQAVATLAEVGTETDVACAETELARCHLLSGDTQSAVDLARRAVARLAKGRRLEAADASLILARAELASGNRSAAMAAYEVTVKRLNDTGRSRRAAVLWRELGDDLLALGLTTDAVNAYQHTADAVRIPRSSWRPHGLSVPAGPRREQTS